VLYLAEVQKKTGFIGGGKADFKLLACQRGEIWTSVPGDEMITALMMPTITLARW